MSSSSARCGGSVNDEITAEPGRCWSYQKKEENKSKTRCYCLRWLITLHIYKFPAKCCK